MTYRNFLLLFFFVSICFACKKDKIVSSDCEQLKNGMVASNKDDVKIVISKFISSLSSQDYTEENVNKLVNAISQSCNVSATVLCFDCVETLPTQSELQISYDSSGMQIRRIIDITYDKRNKIIFSSMHH